MRRATFFLFAAALLSGQERIDSEMNWKIRREAMERSRVMRTLHKLTDRYGPRLTGSPNYKAAADYVAGLMTGWGLQNVRLESWDFGHPGWSNERAAGYLVSPVRDNLVLEVVAWTPSTNGAVRAEAVNLIPPERPTKEELTAWLDANKNLIKGKIVLLGKAAEIRVGFAPANKRIDDAEARTRFAPDATPGPPPFVQQAQPQPRPGQLPANQAAEMIDAWLVANGALVRVNDAGRDHGQIRAFSNRTYDLSKTVPTVVLRAEDYGRIARLLADNDKVELEFDIVNRLYPEGKTSYNVVAEIPGSDKADEVVILGGHLDSWHSATGATDNATGVSVMMEAARILHSLGAKPRRTIRVALWSAEEQGLLGSQAYVKEHYGVYEEQKPDYSKFGGYLNLDSGTGRVRGASVFGPPEAAAAVRAALAPFEDLGVMGAAVSRTRRTGGSDHTSFNVAGLPGIGLNQDPIEYGTHTWHTNLDTYERAVPEDLVKSSIVAAALAWHLANRDELLPRFPKEQMPAPPKPEGAKPEAAKPEAAKPEPPRQ